MPRRSTRVRNALDSENPRKTKRPRISKTPFQKTDSVKDVDQLYLTYMKALLALPYKEYLQSQHWSEIRKAALSFYGKRCAACGSSENKLHVHHVCYKNKGRESMADLIILCEFCHKAVSESIKQRKESRETAIEARETP